MVLNSTVINVNDIDDALCEKGNTAHLVVNTTDFNDQDFDEFLTISEGIERTHRNRKSNRRRSSRHNTIVATMTREEIFESTNLDDDQFLNALEHQTSYGGEDVADVGNVGDMSTMSKTVLLNSIENLMKYFDEDITVNDSSLKLSPTKLKTKGKVASAMASLRSKAGTLTHSPFSKRKNKQKLEVNTQSIQELKKRYESLSPDGSLNKSTSSKLGKLSPKLGSLRKSKVKQMASLFNTKINSMMRKDSPEPQTPEPISPGLDSLASPNFTSTLKQKSPRLKPKLPTFIAKLPSPKPSPLFKRRQMQKSPSISSLSGSPFTRRKQLQKQPSTTCLVAENVFSQLSVKDKALLYNKFIGDMSKKNPKFQKHAQVLESNVRKEISRGEVVIEKQGTVKNIRDSLEAKFTPSKTTLCKTLQRFKRSPADLSFSPPPLPLKSKEFEDILRSETPTTPLPDIADSEDPLHVSTLTVVLKPSPNSKKSTAKPRTSRKKRFLTDLGIIEPSQKRTQTMIRSSVQVEPFAPPKKIRRTQHERLAPKMFFQNQHLETLFYNWLKEKNGVAFDITPLNNKSDIIEIVPKNKKEEMITKHRVDQLLEQAINKLEAENKKAQVTLEDCAIKLIKKTVEEEIEKSIIEVELPLEMSAMLTEKKKQTKKDLNDDSDFCFTSMNKATGEDSPNVMLTKKVDASYTSQNISSLKSSSKPIRKKKLKRSLTWKKESSLVEANPIFSTDSDSDCKPQVPSNKTFNSTTLPKSKKCSSYVKKLLFKTINTSLSSEQSNATQPELSIVELDRSLMRHANSPSTIKNNYTLTVMSSPSPATESDFCDSDLPPSTPSKDFSRSWPASLQDAGLIEEGAIADDLQILTKDKEVPSSSDYIDKVKTKMEKDQTHLMMDSFIDQGFETGSNDMDSPMRLSRKASEKDRENPKNFSTPLKGSIVNQIFTAPLGQANQQSLLSPIPINNPPINRKNLTMQVIREDYALEESKQLAQSTPNSERKNVNTFLIADNSTTPLVDVSHKVETSQFWIASGDFTVGLNIHYYEPERLMLLSNIFGQKCMEYRNMTFGIDQQIFCPDGAAITQDELLRKVPRMENCSQYWFSTGEVVLPFAGKKMNEKKIELFFSYIREFLEEGQQLRFGIDTFEFSQIYQAGYNTTEFCGTTWSSTQSPVKTSDLDQSDFESVEFEQSLTFSALGNSQASSDSGSLKSEELIMANHQNYSSHDEEIPAGGSHNTMDQIFEDARNLNLTKTHTDRQLAMESQFTIPEMLKTLQTQQLKLKQLEERMQSCNARGKDTMTMAHFGESPEYMRKLRSIIAAIDNIGRGNGFNACSIEQLESFMFFLSRYADLCLANCTAHIEKILDVVMHHQRSFQQQHQQTAAA